MATIKVKEWQVCTQQSYMFDTNIWLYIFGPIAGSERDAQRKYSDLLYDIQNRESTIFITSLILAEYINAALRICFSNWKRENGVSNADYKRDYRPTNHYRDSLEDVKSQVHDILQITTRRNDDFQTMTFNALIPYLDRDCDYNDAYILKYCMKNKFSLVTDDKDIAKQNINETTIITR